MIERFAKIIETPTTQVLCFLEYDEAADQHVLNRIGSTNGLRWNVAIRWDGDDHEKAVKALNGIDDAAALKLVESMNELCAESGGEGGRL